MGEHPVAPSPVDDAGAPRPPGQPGPGLRPALLVVGIALFIVVLFGVGSALSGDSGTPGTGRRAGPSVPAKVAGTTLRAEPAAGALAPIVQPGTPPADILDALALPVGATRVGHSATNPITLFNASERFVLPGSEASVITFFRSELAALGWRIVSVGAARGTVGATEVLGEKAGSDGWYWEVGAVVSPTTFAPPGAGSSAGSGLASPTGTTPFELRLFQVNDTAA